jgi:hypothetical protein
VVDHRGERGGLARTGGAGDEHESTRFVGKPGDHGWKPEFGDGGPVGGDTTQRHADAAPLMEDVHPEATDTGHRVREVDFAVVLERRLLPVVHHAHCEYLCSLGVERLELTKDDELAVEPNGGRAAGLNVKVRRALLRHELQESVDLSHASSPRTPGTCQRQA